MDVGHLCIRFSLIDEGQVVVSVEETFFLEERMGLYNVVRASLIEHGTPLVFEGPCDSYFYPYHDVSVHPWFDRPDAESQIS